MLKGNRKLAAVIAGVVGVCVVAIVGRMVDVDTQVALPAIGAIAALCGVGTLMEPPDA